MQKQLKDQLELQERRKVKPCHMLFKETILHWSSVPIWKLSKVLNNTLSTFCSCSVSFLAVVCDFKQECIMRIFVSCVLESASF